MDTGGGDHGGAGLGDDHGIGVGGIVASAVGTDQGQHVRPRATTTTRMAAACVGAQRSGTGAHVRRASRARDDQGWRRAGDGVRQCRRRQASGPNTGRRHVLPAGGGSKGREEVGERKKVRVEGVIQR